MVVLDWYNFLLFANSQHHTQRPAPSRGEVSANDSFRETLNCPQR